ncbi:MAG: hypothetical protein ACE5F7_05140 [Nitrospiria bacterium]
MGFFIAISSTSRLETGRAENRKNRLFTEKVRSLHRQIPPGIFPAFFCAASYALIVWDSLSRRTIVVWLLVQTAALAGRAALYRSYRSDAESLRNGGGNNGLHC